MSVTTVTTDAVNAPTLCRRAGITYRQVDHWCRLGVLRPIGAATPGSGAQRRFPRGEVRVAAAIAELRDIGVPLEIARRAAEQLRTLTDGDWSGRVFVTPSGAVVRHLDGFEACWYLRLDGLAA